MLAQFRWLFLEGNPKVSIEHATMVSKNNYLHMKPCKDLIVAMSTPAVTISSSHCPGISSPVHNDGKSKADIQSLLLYFEVAI